jgi:fucose 4-O-acetylase-like acetyltransferase
MSATETLRPDETAEPLNETSRLLPQDDNCDSCKFSVSRQHSLDNLRSFLTALVILHHTAIPYGGAGGWEVHSRCFPPKSLALIVFNAVDQTFFMAMFFFLSGKLWNDKLRKSPENKISYVRPRLLRILLPAVVYTFMVEPTVMAMVWTWDALSNNHRDNVVLGILSVYWLYWTRVVLGSSHYF